jgi:predicted dehydrogenase
MTQPVKIVVVGTGGISSSYFAAMTGNPNVQVVGMVDNRPEAAMQAASLFGVRWFVTVAELLNSGVVFEAAIVCTPPNTHESIAIELAARGVHVLCEKPFSITSASARRMAAAAHRYGTILTMGSKFRYVNDVNAARERIRRGSIGDVVLFENAFTGRVEMSRRWNSMPAISGGGVLIDNGTHSVDILRFFLGPLSEVHAVEGKRIQNLPVEDTARLFVRSEAGVMGSVDLSWSLNKELDWYVNIFGSEGLIQVGWKTSRMKVGNGDWEVFGQGYDKVQAFRSQVNNFARAIHKLEPLVITWEDALASVNVIEAAYDSMRASGWTGVKTSCPLTNTPAPIGETAIHREVVRV